ncbi:MAG: DUF433 domain-containing protein [Dethiobacter sp.]|nr:MAG: DUF433 domain-containing protein [Dethiobacter sp.]
MNWKEYIHADPNILAGKPVIKGTRLSVVFILELLGSGWTEQQILDNYPSLKPEHLKAVFTFAGECLKEDSYLELSLLEK